MSVVFAGFGAGVMLGLPQIGRLGFSGTPSELMPRELGQSLCCITGRASGRGRRVRVHLLPPSLPPSLALSLSLSLSLPLSLLRACVYKVTMAHLARKAAGLRLYPQDPHWAWSRREDQGSSQQSKSRKHKTLNPKTVKAPSETETKRSWAEVRVRAWKRGRGDFK